MSQFCKIKSSWILQTDRTKLYLVAVGETGFKHGQYKKATRFPTKEDLDQFKNSNVIFWPTTAIQIHESIEP